MTSTPCRQLSTDGERRAAMDLVRRAYEAEGYRVTDSISKYLDAPGARTFGLFRNETLIGTLSIVPDTEGLPMDSLYARELAPWRASGKTLAEVVQFAVDRNERHSPFAAAPLFAAVLTYARQLGVDYLCISINPKHDRFYSLLGFKKIGEEKQYAAVNAPAIARALPLSRWSMPPLLQPFFSAPTSVPPEA
ncbi:hypothetical protein KGM48_02625 [Patescibacteria group bacterium]|nr:hypothetical protein [Patescibacteria group bacterium]